jgi:lipopolysaccharide export LptBFGC system permease protein LptF
MNEIVSPVANQRRLKIEYEKIEKVPRRTPTHGENIYYSGEDNRFYHLKFIDALKGVVIGFTIYEFSPTHKLERRVDAKKAIWDKGRWHLIDGSTKVFKMDSFEQLSFDSLILTLKEKPSDFIKGTKHPISMGLFEFKRYIEKLQKSGEDVTKQLVNFYTRISFPFMNLIVILLGFPLASRVRSIGVIIGFTVALLVSFIYWGLMQLAKAFGHAGTLAPVVASILPNTVFIVAGIILMWRFKR